MGLALASAPLVLAAGCGDSDTPPSDDGSAGAGNDGNAGAGNTGNIGNAGAGNDASAGAGNAGGDGSIATGGQPSGSEEDAVFGIGTLVTANELSTDYLLLVPNLELGGAQLKLDEAREFSGQSDLAAHEGSLLVASGDAPTIVKYSVDEERQLVPGKEVNFTNYGIPSAAFWNNQFVAKDKAYLLNGASEIIIWNPEKMRIDGAVPLPELEARPGLRVVAGLADRSSLVHNGKYYVPLYWTDDVYAERSDDSVIVVVDVATDTVEGTITADCPGLDYATEDDDGKLHFSNWTGGVGTHYVLGTAQNCIATLDPETEEVTTKTFASITGGHEGAALKYAGNGRFVLSVFDEVRADVANADDPFEPVGGLNWQLWSYDPASGEEAKPIEGVDWNSGAIIHTRIDGTLYSMVPGAGYASTVVYSIGESSAEPVFGITGWSFRLFKVR